MRGVSGELKKPLACQEPAQRDKRTTSGSYSPPAPLRERGDATELEHSSQTTNLGDAVTASLARAVPGLPHFLTSNPADRLGQDLLRDKREFIPSRLFVPGTKRNSKPGTA